MTLSSHDELRRRVDESSLFHYGYSIDHEEAKRFLDEFDDMAASLALASDTVRKLDEIRDVIARPWGDVDHIAVRDLEDIKFILDPPSPPRVPQVGDTVRHEDPDELYKVLAIHEGSLWITSERSGLFTTAAEEWEVVE